MLATYPIHPTLIDRLVKQVETANTDKELFWPDREQGPQGGHQSLFRRPPLPSPGRTVPAAGQLSAADRQIHFVLGASYLAGKQVRPASTAGKAI